MSASDTPPQEQPPTNEPMEQEPVADGGEAGAASNPAEIDAVGNEAKPTSEKPSQVADQEQPQDGEGQAESEANKQEAVEEADDGGKDAEPDAGGDVQKMEVEDEKKPVEKGSMQKTESQAMAALDREEDRPDEIENIKWPTTLEGFGYHFNSDGQLRDIKEPNESFQFKVKEEHAYNQKRYETIGELLTEYVYTLLEEECNLKRVYVPETDKLKKGDKQSFLFMSDDALTNEDKLMVIIHGSGVVRAGQWARRLIMNEDLDKGTQLPYIKKAKEQGYGVIVLNTNLNHVVEDGVNIWIKDHDTPEAHATYVWDHFIKSAPAKHIAVVAHSYGGVVTTDLAIKNVKDFQKRVFAIAFTDSVHSLSLHDAPSSVTKLFKKRAKNWVSSAEPLDEPSEYSSRSKADAPKVSAGHPKHEWTSYSAFESVFKFINDKYATADEPDEKEEL